jgi:hypothetical protein
VNVGLMSICSKARCISPKKSSMCIHGCMMNLTDSGDYIITQHHLAKTYINYDLAKMCITDLEKVLGDNIINLIIEQHNDNLNDEFSDEDDNEG